MISIRTRDYIHEGHRLVYDEYGSGPRPLILVPGLLLPRSLHRPLATALAEHGNRVIAPDLLGHGEADRPRDMTLYSMSLFAEQTIGLMDHLGLDEAVVAGPSLGANIALETCMAAPERVRATVLEMPVLDNALLGIALAFTPVLVAVTVGEPVTRVGTRILRALPRLPSKRALPHLVNVLLDAASQDPGPMGSYLQGIFFGRIAPTRAERRLIQTPALVLGHPRDPVHPFADADALARELPNARMVKAGSLVEMRLSPKRLTDEVARFVDESWRPAAAPARRRRRAAS
jgi:pimeloyl-ACP methyl ester carboxylesterase